MSDNRKFLFKIFNNAKMNSILVSVFIFIVLNTLIIEFISLQKAKELANVEKVALRNLMAVRAGLESELSKRLNLPRALKAFVIAHPKFTKAEFDSFANDLTRDVSGVMSLQLAPDAIVTYTTNEKKNAAAIGHDLIADPDRRPAELPLHHGAGQL